MQKTAFGWPAHKTQDGGVYVPGRTPRDAIHVRVDTAGRVLQVTGRVGAFDPQKEVTRFLQASG
jgi:hypothetical protein